MITAIAGGAVILIVAVLLGIKFLLPGPRATADAAPVAPSVLHNLTTVSTSVSNTVGQGSVQQLPVAARDKMLLGSNGKPQITYFGAEYCPYCAAERWSVIVALSRFGDFSGLQTSRSAADDVFPNTPTFTFYGSKYQSSYVDFTALELQSNVKVGGSYQTLQKPTKDQQALIAKYDAPPYVTSDNSGAIPFIDVANQYVASGTSFSPATLGTQTWQQISAKLSDPSTPEAKGIVGGANVLTAAICQATSNTPADACDQPAIKQIGAKLQASKPPSSAG